MASRMSTREPAMTLVRRGSGRWSGSSPDCSIERRLSDRYVERAELATTTCSHVVKRDRPSKRPMLRATCMSAS